MKKRIEARTSAASRTVALPVLLLCLFAATALLSPPLRADSYDKLKRSKEMRDFERQTHKKRLKSDYKQGDLDPDSNLAKALNSRPKDKLLMVWAEGGLMGFLKIDESAKREERYVINQSTFRDQQSTQKIVLQIILPFPRYRMQADLGFIEEMAALQPPRLKTTSSEEIRIGPRKATLYRHEGGDCSVVMNLPQGALLSAQALECKSDKRLKSFVHMLNLSRLERKLNS